ncbi:MAG: 3-keto-5-aminohexanoate cleavage protein [Limibacillus sp.]
MTPVSLEEALNGPWSRSLQPGMPITTEELIAEGVACAKLGAAVIHLHVYDPATGRQRDDFDAYRAVIEGIREEVDAIVYPTLPLSGSADAPEPMSPEARFEATRKLAEAGLIEWAVIDPGSATFASFAEIEADRPGFLYSNPEADVRYGLALARDRGFHPSYAIYEPGFARLGAALAARYPGLPKPLYRFMFSEGFAFGYPPRGYALESYLKLMEELDPDAPWMIGGLQVDVLPLAGEALARGGHLRVGLEDAPFGSDWSNTRWTEAALGEIQKAGARPATAPEVRARFSAA